MRLPYKKYNYVGTSFSLENIYLVNAYNKLHKKFTGGTRRFFIY